MNDLDRIRMITVNFSMLQGLKMVPLGLLLTVVSLWGNSGTGPRRDLLFPSACVVAAFFLYLLFSRYYAREYGTVQPSAVMRRNEIIRGLGGGIVALAAFLVDVNLKPPVSFIGLVLGLATLGEHVWLSRRIGGRVEPIIIGVALFITILSLLPLAGVNWWQPLGIRARLFGICVITGIIFMVVGIWEHVRLVKLLPPPKGANHEQRV